MRVFATRVWGFDPARWPVITFGLEGNRDKLLNDSAPGDRILFVGTQGEPTPEAMRGRLLGIAEIGRRPVDTTEVIGDDARGPHDYDEHGRFRWPKAILMLRAWRFDPQPPLRQVLAAQLPYHATPSAVELSQSDAAAVLALSAVEVEIPYSETLARLRLLDQALAASRPTTGPAPTSWSGEAGRDANRAAYSYALRFGDTDVWKIGHAIDVKQRVKDVNKHIPTEVLPHVWRPVWTHPWPTEAAAYEMEQRVFRLLEKRRTGGERVMCAEAELWAAWQAALGV